MVMEVLGLEEHSVNRQVPRTPDPPENYWSLVPGSRNVTVSLPSSRGRGARKESLVTWLGDQSLLLTTSLTGPQVAADAKGCGWWGVSLSLKSLSKAGDEAGVFRVSLKPFLLCHPQN